MDLPSTKKMGRFGTTTYDFHHPSWGLTFPTNLSLASNQDFTLVKRDQGWWCLAKTLETLSWWLKKLGQIGS